MSAWRLAAAALVSLCAFAPADARAATAPAPRHAGVAHRPVRRATPAGSPFELAGQTRMIEEIGGWGRAAEMMRTLRGRIAPDPDLELMLAWCEARSGQLDSAAARIAQPLLTKAGDDSLPAGRAVPYAWTHETTWFDRLFDGWHWYVWRTRAELAAAQGRWPDALAAARRALGARPQSGIEWYLRALCAGHVGLWDEARSCDEEALALDPTLPEAHYLMGLLAWREGRRNDAQARFRVANALDSSYAAPALALMKSRLPGAAPDTLPGELLNGERRAGLLTAPELPKREVFVQDSTPASVLRAVYPADVDTTGVIDRNRPRDRITLSMLVGSDGRIALVDLPPYSPAEAPIEKVSHIVAQFPQWRFRPATRGGRPVPAWVAIEFAIIP